MLVLKRADAPFLTPRLINEKDFSNSPASVLNGGDYLVYSYLFSDRRQVATLLC